MGSSKAVLAGLLILAGVVGGLVLSGALRLSQDGEAAPDFPQANPEVLRSLSTAFVDVAKRVTPSVVTITSERVVTNPHGSMEDLPPELRRWFGRFFEAPGEPEEFRSRGLGSGVIVRSDGIILTNNHVVEDADEIKVVLSDGREIDAEVKGTDPRTDVAVLKVGEKNLPAAPLGDSDQLQVGEWVLAIGSPFSENLQHTVTAGIVSAKGRRNLGIARYEDLIQTDAAINPGNSGGALLDLNGNVVGINTAIASRAGFAGMAQFAGVGFAIPINMARAIMEDLLQEGRVIRGYMGVNVQTVTPSVARALDLSEPHGALVATVVEGSPADQAGVKVGDVIVELDGKAVRDSNSLANQTSLTRPGTAVTIKLIRGGKELELRVTLEELPEEQEQARPAAAQTERPSSRLGLEVGELTPRLAERFGYENAAGVLVAGVRPGGAAFDAGLRDGDLIQEVNRRSVASVEQFQSEVDALKPGATALLYVRRGDGNLFLPLEIPRD
ncbi:MAG TPA: DegQ family serine endoprotease [Acidobacteriota bacterium]